MRCGDCLLHVPAPSSGNTASLGVNIRRGDEHSVGLFKESVAGSRQTEGYLHRPPGAVSGGTDHMRAWGLRPA